MNKCLGMLWHASAPWPGDNRLAGWFGVEEFGVEVDVVGGCCWGSVGCDVLAVSGVEVGCADGEWVVAVVVMDPQWRCEAVLFAEGVYECCGDGGFVCALYGAGFGEGLDWVGGVVPVPHVLDQDPYVVAVVDQRCG